MNKRLTYLTLLFLFFNSIWAQNPDSSSQKLKQKLELLARSYKASIGIAVIHVESKQSLVINNEHHYPMQSVYKFHLALAILHQVDLKKIALSQKVHVTKDDLRPNTWSPLREKFPDGNIDVTISELLDYTVSKSDNNTCDILFKLLGGTAEVQKYIHGLGIKKIAIAATEEEMARAWEVQYTNWTEPSATADLLNGFYNKKYLSRSNTDFLLKLMIESSNSGKRIKGLLPKETTVAHKTGSSNTNSGGLTAATNDIGIITLPSGKHLAISVFVSDSKENFETNEKIIAEISKIAFDHFNR